MQHSLNKYLKQIWCNRWLSLFVFIFIQLIWIFKIKSLVHDFKVTYLQSRRRICILFWNHLDDIQVSDIKSKTDKDTFVVIYSKLPIKQRCLFKFYRSFINKEDIQTMGGFAMQNSISVVFMIILTFYDFLQFEMSF